MAVTRGSFSLFIFRFFIFALGFAGLLWALIYFVGFSEVGSIERLGKRILRLQQPYRLVDLLRQEPMLQRIERQEFCNAGALRGAALLRLRVAEDTFGAGQASLVDERMTALDNAVRLSLSCNPNDAFLWLIMFWLENTRNGFSEKNLSYLRQSYVLGPNEGWIILKRNHVALTLYPALPDDLKESARQEFAQIVRGGLFDEAIALLTGPGVGATADLVAALDAVPRNQRDGLRRELVKRDIHIPGFSEKRTRPW